MKKLLELLGTILITSNAAGPLVVNKPNNNNNKIKNSLETLTRQKRQAPQAQTDIIEKEITLDENYSENIQKMLKEFMKNNQIDPLRMINNEGIVTTDYYETDKRKKDRKDNLEIIIKELDKILELSQFNENKTIILILTLKNNDNKNIKLVINLNNFYVLGIINNQNQYFYFDDELVEKVKQKNKADIEILEKQIKETSNKNQLGKLNKKLKNLQGESLKIDEQKIKTLNTAVIKKYNCQKTNLNYTGAYSEQSLNAVNINITKENLNKTIANLAILDNDNKQNQAIKDDLVRMIFVTSEGMRFGSYLKYFNYEKNGQPVEFKNIPTNVQEILNSKINSLKWKDYKPQLIGGWTASSKYLEQKRKEIFKKLNKQIILSNFLSKNNEELNKIFKKSSIQSQNWETNVKPEIESIIKNSNNQEYINLETDILKNINYLFTTNEKEINFLKQWDNNLTPSVININKMDNYYNLIRSVIVQGNLDLFELIITKKPELINVNNNDLTFLQVAIANHKIDIVKLLLSHGANVDEKGKYDSSALYTATFHGDIDIVKLLLSYDTDVNARENNGLTPLHVAIDREYLNIVSILLDHGADVNAKDYKVDLTPLITTLSSNNINIFIKLITNKNSKDKININESNKKVNNWTPLHFATQKNQIQFVKILLAHGADVNITDNNGNTALYYAARKGYTEVENLLKEFKKLKDRLDRRTQDDTVKEQIN
ncbi:ankyrin repeat domain-containing protein [Spiroplasma endosymbiont of Lonchoptera lutea]|uniref:ankyrin repeat domain-containing protein n=1 Tax=Spiroplasma endosymbiont of Lonchoptera lutea TaxID=3066297 RepID=UPI0030D2E178